VQVEQCLQLPEVLGGQLLELISGQSQLAGGGQLVQPLGPVNHRLDVDVLIGLADSQLIELAVDPACRPLRPDDQVTGGENGNRDQDRCA
jgi:hypothetical protein